MLRVLVWMLSAGAIIAGAGAVSGQAYPTRPIRIVAPEAGGGTDFVARLVAQGLSGALGQQVIVDNRGGSVVIPGELVAKAPPDGHTLLLNAATFWIVPLMQDAPYDPVKGFAPITLAVKAPNILLAHPSVPANTVRELIALAKAKPGMLNYGGSIAGSSTHLAVELFKSMAGVDIVRIPYKGQGPSLNALVAGEVQLIITSAASAMPHVKSGRLRALAVTSAQPSAMFPGLPAAAATVPGYEAETLFCVFAPAGTPAPIVNRLQQEIARAVNSAEVKDKLFAAGLEPAGGTPAQLAAMMKADMVRMGKVIKDAGIRAD